jgi:hypothetical protein
MPRAGDQTWVKSFNVPHTRVVNNNDVVTKFPISRMGYDHHGEVCYFDHNGDIVPMSGMNRIRDYLWGWLQAIVRMQFFNGYKDHALARYRDKINTL